MIQIKTKDINKQKNITLFVLKLVKKEFKNLFVILDLELIGKEETNINYNYINKKYSAKKNFLTETDYEEIITAITESAQVFNFYGVVFSNNNSEYEFYFECLDAIFFEIYAKNTEIERSIAETFPCSE
ncbi:hypothetical protein [Hugenholtzia roseola]|uniref:hypothetical protein n=1 Tax=Hugenholtzia roseola TaxID=1002 RepID=UPI00047DEF9E|nr:hypothetical protein [Hugenholtzia roseola]